MRLSRLLLSIPLLVATAPLAAQQGTGRIVGRIVEASQGAPLAGAEVQLVGTPIRATSALDGRFSLQQVPAGTATVAVRLIGFQPKTVTGIVVTDGAIVEQNIALSTHVVELQEVTVSAAEERGSVAAAVDEQRNATNIVNAITSEQIEKSPDSDAGQAVQRVSGVTVQDGKYVFVRGLGERYTTTSLNGARIPSPEPERKVVPLDLFPSGLLEGITTSKTFTPDQSGDFSGAQVNLKTREFNAGRVLAFSVSGSYNSQATFKNVVRAPTEGGDWFAFGASKRALPGAIRDAGNLSGVGSPTDQNLLIGQFRNVWSARSGDAAPNGSMGVSLGGAEPLFGQTTNYLLSFNYANTQEVRKDEQRGLAVGDTILTRPFNMYTGELGRRSVLWGGLANFGMRIGSYTKISLDNTFTRSADNEAQVLVGENEEFSQFNPLYLTRLSFIERSVRSNQLLGEHLLGSRNFVDWSVTNARVTRDEPDRSDVAYTASVDGSGIATPTTWPGTPRFATRTFSSVTENSWNLAGNYRLTLGNFDLPTQVKVGGVFRSTNRDSDTRAYDIYNRTLSQQQLQAAPEDVFSQTNLTNDAFILNANANAGRYTADEKIGAGYAMIDIPLGSRLRVVAGARVERWQLDVNSVTTTGIVVPARPRNTDVLPSLALNITLSETHQLRLSATQTLSRPEYRELSSVPYFEQIGLLTTFGNPDLKRALIQNFDARWEWYPGRGETVSFGAFYKRFNDPIEKVIILQAGTSALSFVNADHAQNYGGEIEIRKDIGARGDAGAPLTIFANTTLMKSDITPGNTGTSALTRANRPMVGQSEYVVNAGIGLTPIGAVNLTLLYNVAGRRILEAGSGGLPDAYEEARHLVDATLQIPLGSTASLRFDGKNLLDAPYRLTQGQVTRQRYKSGRVFGFGVSWRP